MKSGFLEVPKWLTVELRFMLLCVMAEHDKSLDRPATEADLEQLLQQGLITRGDFAHGAAFIGLHPNPPRWFAFLSVFLTSVATLFLIAGVVFFFAFNWASMPAWLKLAVTQVFFVLGLAFSWHKGIESLPSKLGLAFAAVLLGVIFAVYGQIYQTGADSYELFVTWAVLMLPFAWVARSAVLWLFWLLIVQVAVSLFMQQELGIGHWSIDPKHSLAVHIEIAILFFFLVVWEVLRVRGTAWMQDHWPARVIFTLLLIQATLLVSLTIVDLVVSGHQFWGRRLISDSDRIINIGLYLGVVLAAFVYYQYRTRDLFVLSLTSFSVGVVSIVWLISWLFVVLFNRFMWTDPPVYVALIVAGVIFVESTLALFWLRRKQHAWAKIK